MDNADQNPSSSAAPSGGAPKKRCVGCGSVILIVLILSGVVGAWCYWLWKSEPAYWVEHEKYLQSTTPEQRMVIAESVEKRIFDKLSAMVSSSGASSSSSAAGSSGQGSGSAGVEAAMAENPDAVHSLLLTTEEINAWLNQRLGGWASNQGMSIPDFIEEPMLAIEGKNLVIAFRFEKPPISQVVSLISRVVIKKGEAIIQVRGVRSGRLRVPGVKAASKAVGSRGGSSEFAKAAEKITEVFDGKAFDPVIKLNHKKIRMLSFVLQKDGALIKFKAVSKKKG